MKQYKMKNLTPSATTHTSTAPSTTRQEIDVYLKELTQLVEKNPQKAAKVFEDWLAKSSKSNVKKRAA